MTFSADISLSNPLSDVLNAARSLDWPCQAFQDGEMVLRAGNLDVFLRWSDMENALYLSCACNSYVQTNETQPLTELLALINEKTTLGFFSFCKGIRFPLYRYTLLVDPNDDSGSGQMSRLLSRAVQECLLFSPCFDALLLRGKSPEEAISLGLLVPMGRA